MTWLLLACAIISEVVGTVSLKFAEGFSRLVPSILVVLGYGGAFALLSVTLKRGMPVGTAYAVWAGAGVALVALAGMALFGENMTGVKALGLVLIVGGVAALQFSGAH